MVAVAICLCIALLLAVVAYRGSKETGGGAAQGDLGFLDRLIAKRARSSNRGLRSVIRVSAATWAVLTWDWFFLWFIWRA
jgi:hypothetical protein